MSGAPDWLIEFLLGGSLFVSVIINVTLFKQRHELDIAIADLEWAEMQRLIEKLKGEKP
jgi:hypothetical protein